MIKKFIIFIIFAFFFAQLASAEELALKQGEVMLVPANYSAKISAYFGGVKMPVFTYHKKKYILVAADVNKQPGNYNLRIKSGTKELAKQVIKVSAGDYKKTFTGKPYQFSTLSKDEKAGVSKDKNVLVAKLNKAVAEPNPKLWQSLFRHPLDNITVTGVYGSKRVYTNHTTTHHGVDYRAQIGTPIYAISDGVVLWGKGKALFQEGPMVALDHGQGITSKYLHMSEVLVSAGDTVKGGDLLGYSGDKGADVSGAHLHFAIKVGSASVNPDQFIFEFQKLKPNSQ